MGMNGLTKAELTHKIILHGSDATW